MILDPRVIPARALCKFSSSQPVSFITETEREQEDRDEIQSDHFIEAERAPFFFFF